VEAIACPICDSRDLAPTPGASGDPLLDGAASSWAICKGCGLVLQSPRPTAAELQELYSSHAYHAHNDASAAETLAYALRRPLPLLDYVAPYLREQPVVLDVGCGLGGGVLACRLRGWEAHGVEPDPALAQVAQGLGLDVEDAFFTADSFPGLVADLVYTCHAFEHFVDPLEIARAARAKVADDGHIFVCVPTFRGARTWAREWMNVAHTFLFTDKTLGNLLFRAGFETVAHRYNAAEGELWLLARAAQVPPADAPLPYTEPWRSVQRELSLVVPARAAAWWVPRRLARNAHHLPTLALDPQEFAQGVRRRLARRRRIDQPSSE
jgi:SAM-dependent methyltransferase